CGLENDTLEAKEADNLITWWQSHGNGRTGRPPAYSDSTGNVEVHLFGYKEQQSGDRTIKFKFNYHVPIEGFVNNLQRKSGQKVGGKSNLKYVKKKVPS